MPLLREAGFCFQSRPLDVPFVTGRDLIDVKRSAGRMAGFPLSKPALPALGASCVPESGGVGFNQGGCRRESCG